MTSWEQEGSVERPRKGETMACLCGYELSGMGLAMERTLGLIPVGHQRKLSTGMLV